MIFTEYLAINMMPAQIVKEACKECSMAVIINNGIITEIVKEK